MSATNRGARRIADDYYATPGWCTRAIIPHLGLEPSSVVLDPCCGDGAIFRFAGAAKFRGIEVNASRAFQAAALARVQSADALNPATAAPSAELQSERQERCDGVRLVRLAADDDGGRVDDFGGVRWR